MAEHDLTTDAIQQFAERLTDWAKSLPETDRALLGHLVDRAAHAPEDDTAGYFSNLGLLPASQTGAGSGAGMVSVQDLNFAARSPLTTQQVLQGIGVPPALLR